MDQKYFKKIYDYLIFNKIATEKQIDKIFKDSSKNNLDIFDVLVKNKIVDEEGVAKIKAYLLNIPYINLKEIAVDSSVLKEVPERVASFYKFIPFEKVDSSIKIAMVDPTNVDALDALKFISVKYNINTKIYITSEKSFSVAMKQYRKFGKELENVLKNVDEQIIDKSKIQKEKKYDGKILEEAPVTKIVDIIISHAIESRASDIHVEPNEDNLRIRYRLDGVLYNTLVLPKKISVAVVSRIKILSNLKIDETRKPQDGRIKFTYSSSDNTVKSVDLRVSTFPTVNGEKVVMRILDPSSGIDSLEKLGVLERDLNIIDKNIKKPFGIILVTGPTGSGKSTTLYAMLKILNKEGVNIVTLEDPIEYLMAGINQSQIKPEIGYSFSSGLRSILRQDPDIVMVGEIRDKNTAELATHAALTGHLVLSTLHTNDALGVIPRLVDMGIEPFLISSSLNIAVGQRLVRRICKFCKKEIEPPPSIKEIIKKELARIPEDQKKGLNLENGIKIFQGEGCSECKQSGTFGRIGIYEILFMTPEIEEKMSSKITESDIAEEAYKQGMITMRQDGIIKSLLGITTIEEVLRVTED